MLKKETTTSAITLDAAQNQYRFGIYTARVTIANKVIILLFLQKCCCPLNLGFILQKLTTEN
jgi:hypothetical protein